MSEEARRFKVENATVDNYQTHLKEKSRSPSKGGNTRAWHAHKLEIGEAVYSFLTLGAKKWIYAGDTVSFDYEENGPYLNILRDTIKVLDKNGKVVVRGERGTKKWRTASQRAPVSRREWSF